MNSVSLFWASSHVRWLNSEQTNISRTISGLIIREGHRFPDDKNTPFDHQAQLLA